MLERLQEQPSREDDKAIWEHEYRKSVFDWAAAQIRPRFQDSTWQAFWQTSLEGKQTREVAESLGMSEGAVYIAKCRVLAQLKKKVQEIEP
jgi:RNA polymerase sigma-70 factor (ECF subfamily)